MKGDNDGNAGGAEILGKFSEVQKKIALPPEAGEPLINQWKRADTEAGDLRAAD